MQVNITTEVAAVEKIIYEKKPLLMKIDPKEVAKELFDEKQYGCLVKLLTAESNWRPTAQNSKSTASGIGQMLDGTYKNLGMQKSKAGIVQLVATTAYISRRHVTPCNAWRHFQKENWY